MNRSPSIIVITVLLVLLAKRLVTAHPSSSSNVRWLVLSVSFIALAGLSVVAATEIWRRSQRALRLFMVWLIAYLTIGGATQVISQGVSISESTALPGYVRFTAPILALRNPRLINERTEAVTT